MTEDERYQLRRRVARQVRHMANQIEDGDILCENLESFVELDDGRNALISLQIPWQAVTEPQRGLYTGVELPIDVSKWVKPLQEDRNALIEFVSKLGKTNGNA